MSTRSDTATSEFDRLEVGQVIEGRPFSPTRESIREFCDASLDWNPLHWDDEYMKGDFGRTNFGGIIMHGMTNFGIISRTLTDWLHAHGGEQRRIETRWRTPVRPGDTIVASVRVTGKKVTQKSRWATLDLEVTNQRGETVATGEAMVEFPHEA